MSKIAVIGAGVVGQATGKGLAYYGHQVSFCDVNLARLKDLKQSGYRVFTQAELKGEPSDVSMICVGTPTAEGVIDLSYLRSACQIVGMALRDKDDYHLVVLRSTVPPGTTEEIVLPLLQEHSGKLAHKDFGICYNPEFLREASALQDFVNPWIVVLGAEDHNSQEAGKLVYDPISSRLEFPITITNYRSAEMIKYAHNLYNATKISYTNEIWTVCNDLGIDGNFIMSVVSQSSEGMWNPHYGIKGGFPYGGSCLPKDTLAFLSFVRERGLDMKLLEAVINVNDEMCLRNVDPLALVS